MDIKKLFDKIIPPSDYEHRNGFNNIPIIDKLNDSEKKQLEDYLISNLSCETNKDVDTLIVETLAYLKSEESLPFLKILLKDCKDEMIKLIIAVSIFEINQDNDMINIAVTSFNKLDNNQNAYYIYSLSSAFYYLVRFENTIVNSIIENYTRHKEYLVSYNAKQVLGKID